MTKLFRIRGNGFILFDRFWLYAFRRKWPFCVISVHVGDAQWVIVKARAEAGGTF